MPNTAVGLQYFQYSVDPQEGLSELLKIFGIYSLLVIIVILNVSDNMRQSQTNKYVFLNFLFEIDFL